MTQPSEWPDWIPLKEREALASFWGAESRRTKEDWERYVARSVRGGLAAVGTIRTIVGLSDSLPKGRFVPMWNNIARVIDEDGVSHFGSFERGSGCPVLTESEWRAKARELFGSDPRNARFKCPSCGNIQSVASVCESNPELDENEISRWIYYSCQGRHVDGGCNWTLGGLLRIHRLEVLHEDGSVTPVFEFDSAQVPRAEGQEP